jgi:putative NADPH-quinone reductase
MNQLKIIHVMVATFTYIQHQYSSLPSQNGKLLKCMDISNTIIFHYCIWTTYNVPTIFQHFMNDIFQEFWNEFVMPKGDIYDSTHDYKF